MRMRNRRSSSRSVAWPLAAVVLVSVAAEPAPALLFSGVAGQTPEQTAAAGLTANTPDSPFAGVVGVLGFTFDEASRSYLAPTVGGSGVLISDRHLLTAAHVLDSIGNNPADPLGSLAGDATPDFAAPPAEVDGVFSGVSVFFNHRNPERTFAGADEIRGHRIHFAPAFEGFDALVTSTSAPDDRSRNDDLAILDLAEPAPADIPRYRLASLDSASLLGRDIVIAGHGGVAVTSSPAGDGLPLQEVAGFDFDSLANRHRGANRIASVVLDDELSGAVEGFRFALDRPGSTDDTGAGLEAIPLGGDSGGPNFLFTDLDGDGVLSLADELSVLGITSSLSSNPARSGFGTRAESVLVSRYRDWIAQTLPEPTGAGVWLGGVGLGWLTMRRRSRRRRLV